MPAVSFVSLLPLGDTTIKHELPGCFVFFLRFESYRTKPDGSTPQIANSENTSVLSEHRLFQTRTKPVPKPC